MLAGAKLNARMEDRALQIDSLDVDTGRGDVRAAGRIDLKSAFSRGLLGGSVDVEKIAYDLDLNSVSLSLESIPWIAGILSGQISGTLKFTGTGVSPGTLSAQAAADLASPDFAISGALSPTGVGLSGSARMAGGTITAAPLIIAVSGSSASIDGDYHLFGNALDAGLIIDSPNLAQILEPFGVKAASGPSKLTGKVKGPVMNLAADAEVESKNLSYRNWSAGDTRAALRLLPSGSLVIERLSIENHGSRLDAAGTIHLFDHSFARFNGDLPADLTVEALQLDPGDFISGLNTQGNVSGELRVTRSLTAPDAKISLTGKDLGYHGARIGEVTARAALSGGKVRLERIDIQNKQSRLSLSGAVDLFEPGTLTLKGSPSTDLELNGSTIEIGNFTDAAAGSLSLEGRFTGSPGTLSGKLELSGENIFAAGHPMGNLTGSIRLQDGTLLFAPVMLKNKDSDITLSGSVALLAPGTLGLKENPGLDLSLSAKSIQLGDFDDALSGRIVIDAKISGTGSGLKGYLNVAGQDIDTGVQRFNRIQVGSRLEGRKIYLEPAMLELAPGNQVQARGWISLDREYDFRITSDPIGADKIAVLEKAGLSGGTLKLEITGNGSLENPAGSGSLQLNAPVMAGRSVPDVHLTAALKNQVLDLNADAGFNLSARYHLDSQQFKASAGFTGTDLSPYFGLAGLADLDGRLTGKMEVSGQAFSLRQSTAHLSIADLMIRDGQTELIQARDFVVDLENGQYHIPKERIALLGEGFLAISGSGSLSGNLDFAADGAIPVRVATAFFPDIENPSGRIDLSAALSGTVDDPRFYVRTTLNDIGMTLPVLMQRLHQVNGRIDIDDGSIRFDQVTGKLDTGELDINGAIFLKNLQPVNADVRIDARALPLEIPGTLELQTSAGITLKGSAADAVIGG